MPVKRLLGGNGAVGWSTWPDPFEVGEPTGATHAATKGYVDTASGLLIPKSLLTTKGDLAGRDGSAPARVPAGADGSGLVADSTQTLGVKYLPGDQAANVASQRTLGTGATQAAAGNAAPNAHHASHEPGGSDAMAVDAAAATGSLRTLGTGAAQSAKGSDLASVLAIPRRKITGQIALSSAAVAATNYFAATYAAAVNPSNTTISVFPGISLADWPLDASLYPAIAGLNPLLRLKATTKILNTNPNYVMTIGLYPISLATSAIVPGAIVSGSSTTHTINTSNTTVTTTTSGIALPASGLYVPVATINQAPTTATTPTQITIDLYYA